MANKVRTRYELGRDHRFICTILNDAQTAAVNITNWALSFMVKRDAWDADADALMSMTTNSSPAGIAITGTYNSVPATNTQIATVSIADTDTEALDPGLYEYELKRTDAGFETTLIHGSIELIKRPID